jgi:hypothetical protein
MQKGNKAKNAIFVGKLKILPIQSGNEGRCRSAPLPMCQPGSAKNDWDRFFNREILEPHETVADLWFGGFLDKWISFATFAAVA